jgi:hypothetical protein
MEKEINGHLYIANDNLKRIADALDTIIKMVKEDQERSRKYMEKESEDPFIKTMEAGERE